MRKVVGGGCHSGWGQLLSVTNAIQASTCRQGDSGWAYAGCPGGGCPPPTHPWGGVLSKPPQKIARMGGSESQHVLQQWLEIGQKHCGKNMCILRNDQLLLEVCWSHRCWVPIPPPPQKKPLLGLVGGWARASVTVPLEGCLWARTAPCPK